MMSMIDSVKKQTERSLARKTPLTTVRDKKGFLSVRRTLDSKRFSSQREVAAEEEQEDKGQQQRLFGHFSKSSMAVSRRADRKGTVQSSHAHSRPNKKLFITEEAEGPSEARTVNRSQSIEPGRKRYRQFQTVHVRGGQMGKADVEGVLNQPGLTSTDLIRQSIKKTQINYFKTYVGSANLKQSIEHAKALIFDGSGCIRLHKLCNQHQTGGKVFKKSKSVNQTSLGGTDTHKLYARQGETQKKRKGDFNADFMEKLAIEEPNYLTNFDKKKASKKVKIIDLLNESKMSLSSAEKESEMKDEPRVQEEEEEPKTFNRQQRPVRFQTTDFSRLDPSSFSVNKGITIQDTAGYIDLVPKYKKYAEKQEQIKEQMREMVLKRFQINQLSKNLATSERMKLRQGERKQRENKEFEGKSQLEIMKAKGKAVTKENSRKLVDWSFGDIYGEGKVLGVLYGPKF